MILKSIFQIEPTSKCNFKCEYCIHHKLKRKKEHMKWETFLRAMKWLLYFRERNGGSQLEIALTGVGESFLNPLMPKMIKYARKTCPETNISVSTNGSLITKELCDKIKTDDPIMFVSLHKPDVAMKAVKIIDDAGLRVITNNAFNNSSFNWAGQVDWPVTAIPRVCEYLRQGMGHVLQDGRIVKCCLDGDATSVIGNVVDFEPHENTPFDSFDLCRSCYQDEGAS